MPDVDDMFQTHVPKTKKAKKATPAVDHSARVAEAHTKIREAFELVFELSGTLPEQVDRACCGNAMRLLAQAREKLPR